MQSAPFTLHPQLAADCHLLGHTASGTLLLSRNASLHWFILVPDTDRPDLLDLPAAQLQQTLADSQALSSLLKDGLHYPKVNFAALGNVVPQLHLHIVGRRPDDACWPQPIWGNLPAAATWSEGEIDDIRTLLKDHQLLTKP